VQQLALISKHKTSLIK